MVLRWAASTLVEIVLASAVVFALVALFATGVLMLDARQVDIDMLAAGWPWLWLTVIVAVLFGKFLLTINHHWWSLTPEERQAQRDSDEFGW